VRQLQDTLGNVANQLWVLQVVGSNPAAPTKNTAESLLPLLAILTWFGCAGFTQSRHRLRCATCCAPRRRRQPFSSADARCAFSIARERPLKRNDVPSTFE